MVVTNYISEAKTVKPAKMAVMDTIGHKVRAALWCAQVEQRVVIGLNESIKRLAKSPSDSLFCIMAPSQVGHHIQEVLLEAYCYENDIYMIKVDAAEKLTRILGARRPQTCVLIQKSLKNAADITAIEGELIDYCEEIWNEQNDPVPLP